MRRHEDTSGTLDQPTFIQMGIASRIEFLANGRIHYHLPNILQLFGNTSLAGLSKLTPRLNGQMDSRLTPRGEKTSHSRGVKAVALKAHLKSLRQEVL